MRFLAEYQNYINLAEKHYFYTISADDLNSAMRKAKRYAHKNFRVIALTLQVGSE